MKPGIPGPIPVNCTVTETDSSKAVYRIATVDRALQPDGATYRWKQSYNYASGFGSGSIADYGSYTDATFHTSNDFKIVKR
jgi:hypothetical protein